MEKIKFYFTIFITTTLVLSGIIGVFALCLGLGYNPDMKYATDEMKYAIRLLLPFSTSIATLMIGYFFGKDKGKLEVLSRRHHEPSRI